jgi:hypothetical protein
VRASSSRSSGSQRATFQRDERRESILLWRSGANSQIQTPQIGGGNGRNINYQIDGGDNNDDTVGGLLQLFPPEAIPEFNFITQRYLR